MASEQELTKKTGQSRDSSSLFIRDLDRLDFALFDLSHGITGQSWHLDLQVHGALDECGFIYDFSKLKNLVKQALKNTIDHALVIPVASAENIQFSENERGEVWDLRVKSRISQTDFTWRYICPKGAVYPIRAMSVKTSLLEQEIAKLIRHRLPESVSSIQVSLREEAIAPTEAWFRYTHGLPKHDGLCQRLFHGHRSRIEVFANSERRPDLEHYVTRELLGGSVHIATPNQVKSGHIEIGSLGTSSTPITLAYESAHGYFEGVLPANKVFMVDDETSIECISAFLARKLKKEDPSLGSVKVIAYEGINKGASAEA